jgi:hypothetical protein
MWLRALCFALLAGVATAFAGCGDDDYNGDASQGTLFDLSATADGSVDLTPTTD